MKRNLLVAAVCSLFAAAAFAYNPSGRYETRMVYVPQTLTSILFGGITAIDSGTAKAYYLNDTWEWNGTRWMQRFPAHSPDGRSGFAMVYDSTRARIELFGGHGNPGDLNGDLNDTWAYVNRDWVEIATPNSPPPRVLPGGAYDSARDRFVIFGGTQTGAPPPPGSTTVTATPLYDTWEFDGTNWTQVGGVGPAVTKPLLAYDAFRNHILMLGLDANLNTVMYKYDPTTATWNQVTPSKLPGCVNEGQMAYDPDSQHVIYTGGVCSNTEGTGADTTYQWDGNTWIPDNLTLPDTRVFGAAFDYDQQRQQVTLFGGTPVVGVPVADTWVYTPGSGTWFSLSGAARPAARSLFTFTTDPVNNTIWFYGGTDQYTTYSDFWEYQNGQWTQLFLDTTPTTCLTPNAAFDTDRSKLVVVCATSDVYEFDGTAWTAHTGLKNPPPLHQFASMTYDPTLKKTVLYGGYDSTSTSYLDETWTWDGTSWNRQSNHPAPSRIGAAMWYDPTLKKDVIYGGVGRVTSTDRITRYSDMWTFDGTGWTQITPSGGTPGMRYNAQTVIDPHTNHLLLFGGLLDTLGPPIPPSTAQSETQTYVNDMWEWDGSKWTQIFPATVPSPRDAGRMAYDPTRDEIVLFGGYAGSYFSDTWAYDGTTWSVIQFDPLGGRRRVTGR